MLLRSPFAVALLLSVQVFAAEVPLIAPGAEWRYLDNGSDAGTAWRERAFNDAAWLSGQAQLGYGDGDERTVVSYGPNSAQKHITTYFRRAFNVADPSVFTGLTLRTKRDDGAVVYLNGTEVWRNNMPSGAVGYRTTALEGIFGADESAFLSTAVNPSLLVAGANVVAVEIHQNDAASSDISFDLQLTGTSGQDIPVITRGPYLQMGTPTQVRIRWRTSVATDSRVRYGAIAGNLPLFVDDPTVTTEHEVTLTGLSPATRYFYSVGSTTQTLAGNDASHFFITAPATGSTTATRIWILGDSGTANADAAAVRDAYMIFAGSSTTHLWLMLGDNAYQNGTDAEYQSAVFDMYPTMLRQSVLWPTLGNHDTAGLSTVTPSLPYFQMFSLPAAGEAGGVASGTEKYYSFDYANIHFVCLDSMTSDRSTTGPMLTWLREDLASTTQPWIIAFWHHPPYSKGSHDSDVEVPLVEMRRNALPILEDFGVDLVLAGHSHSYERSFLVDSHYSVSSNFISAMKKDGGSGRPAETGAYRKATNGTAPHEGAVYAVAGSSGKVDLGPFDHPAMFISLAELGSMVLDVQGSRLDAKFLRENGTIQDSFTIIKGPPAAPSALRATAVTATLVDLQWTDNSGDEEGFRIERCAGAQCTTFQTAANATTYADTSATASTSYTYVVRAFHRAATSAPSNTIDVTTSGAPVPPISLSATAVSPTQVNVAWTDASNNEDGFRIERCAGAQCTTFQTASNATTYSDTTASANTAYAYRVRAFNANGDSAWSSTANVTTPGPPAAPTSLTATATSPTQVNLAWTDASNNETGFRIERCAGAQCTTFQTASNAATYSDTTTLANTAYAYRVRAFNVHGDSAASNTANVTTPGPPAAPTNLTATAVSPTQVNLAWTDGSNNEDGFRIERCAGVQCTTFQTASNATTYSDTTTLANTTYAYRVRAFNAQGDSAWSNTENVTTSGAPAPPTNLSATAVSPAQVNLAWTDAANSEDGFRIERCAGAQCTTFQTTSNVTTYADTTVTANTTYAYRVRAFNGIGESAASNTANVTTPGPPAAPTNLTATAVSPTRVNLAWADTANNEGGFRIERCAGVQCTTFQTASNATSHSDTTAAANTTYAYRVRAFNAFGESAASNTAGVTTPSLPPPAPNRKRADFDGEGVSEVMWRHSGGSLAMWDLNGRTLTNGAVFGTIGADWQIEGFGDFDGDRRYDMWLRNPVTREVAVWLLNGRTIVARNVIATAVDPAWSFQTFGDYTGDGRTDAIVRNATTGAVAMWELTPQGQLANTGVVLTVTDARWVVQGTGDFHGDGRDEIVWRHTATNQLAMWEFNGRTLVNGAVFATVSSSDWIIQGFGDFNGDGRSDIALRHRTSNAVAVWDMNGRSVMNTDVVATAGAAWRFDAVGDYNGDGDDEILWHNVDTNQVAMWEMANHRLINGGIILTTASGWRMQPAVQPVR